MVLKRRKNFRPSNGGKTFDVNSTASPCIEWIEMMAPIFFLAVWLCVWYMIQDDSVHAWGFYMQLGYCSLND